MKNNSKAISETILAQRPRGTGRVYKRERTWWIGYYRNGVEIRESAGTRDYNKAVKLLNQRIEEAKKPEFVGPAERRLVVDDLEKKIEANYTRNGQKSLHTAKACLKHVKEYFKYDKLVDITASRIEEYTTHRLDEGAERSTINLELRYLRRGFRLLYDAREISVMPRVHLLGGENIREGFINRPEFDAGLRLIRSDDTRDIIEFLYNSAWRSGEARNLTWAKFDHHDWVFRLSRKDEKTKNPRVLTLEGDLREIITRRLAKRLPDCPYVFHRNGKQVKQFYKAFGNAFREIGLTVTPHDLKRSAIRNFTKAGLGESEGMAISGHKTNSIYKRYNIIDEELQRQSLRRVAVQQQKEAKKARKVVPIKKAG